MLGVNEARERTIADRLVEVRRRRFVGRRAEQALFEGALAGEAEFAVLWIVGPGGIGKTSLLSRFADLAHDHARAVAWVDARHLLGTPESFFAALGDDAAAGGTAGPLGDRRALLIDTGEDLGVLEDWLREELLPSLPADCATVIASRQPPAPSWRRDPAWAELLRVVALRNLAPDDARTYLQRRSLDPGAIDEVARATYGHPLALSLLADLATRGDADAQLCADAPDILTALLERFSVDAPSEAHRTALAVAAHARITDVELLRRAVEVEPEAARGLYDWLAGLSFAVVGDEGLYLHDLAAEVVDADLRRRDATRYLAMHRRVREPCIEALQTRTGVAQARAASDLSWMHRYSPVMGQVIDWAGARSLTADRLAPDDVDPIVAATRRFEGDAAAACVRRWIERQPEAFTLVRASRRQTRGYLATLVLKADERAAWADDPRVVAAFAHADAVGPIRAHERIAVEAWLDYETHLDPGALASQLSIKDIRTWLGGEGVAWSFLALAARHDVWAPMMAYLAHDPVAEVPLGDARYRLYGHDWRAMPGRAFLDLMAEREVLGAEATPEPPPASTVALAREDFAHALKHALRHATDLDALADNPLVRSRVSLELADGKPSAAALRRALDAALETLARAGKDERAHAAVKLTYLDPARTQEAAAELLGLAFSTYRRHLAHGVERMTEWLWQRELHGYDGVEA